MENNSIRSLDDRIDTIERLLRKLKYLPIEDRAIKVAQIAEIVGEKELPANLMLTTEQLQRLHREGMEIGAHTVNHPILSQLPNLAAEQEIIESRDRLREILDDDITSFAYPNGRPNIDYNASHVELLRRAGFKVSVSTEWGCARPGADLFQLPRIAAWDRTPFRFMLRILQTYMKR
jgi:peptidoglycan/xylan/chitin deacetylase (PgdA/CDA1 family)